MPSLDNFIAITLHFRGMGKMQLHCDSSLFFLLCPLIIVNSLQLLFIFYCVLFLKVYFQLLWVCSSFVTLWIVYVQTLSPGSTVGSHKNKFQCIFIYNKIKYIALSLSSVLLLRFCFIFGIFRLLAIKIPIFSNMDCHVLLYAQLSAYNIVHLEYVKVFFDVTFKNKTI